MFGFKSKKMKHMEAMYFNVCKERDDLKEELRFKNECYDRLVERVADSIRETEKVIPLKCCAVIERYPFTVNIDAEEIAKQRIIEELARVIGDYATFKVYGGGDGVKYMEALIRIVAKDKEC